MKHKRPTCINYGCNKLCTYSYHRGPMMGKRYRSFCATCHKVGFGFIQKIKKKNGEYRYYTPKLAKGVTPFKTGKCSNQKHGQKGYLGFPCPMNYKKAPWAIGITELDHKDGNHLNNTIKNTQELCNPCHVKKSKLSGDFREQTKYAYKGR